MPGVATRAQPTHHDVSPDFDLAMDPELRMLRSATLLIWRGSSALIALTVEGGGGGGGGGGGRGREVEEGGGGGGGGGRWWGEGG